MCTHNCKYIHINVCPHKCKCVHIIVNVFTHNCKYALLIHTVNVTKIHNCNYLNLITNYLKVITTHFHRNNSYNCIMSSYNCNYLNLIANYLKVITTHFHRNNSYNCIMNSYSDVLSKCLFLMPGSNGLLATKVIIIIVPTVTRHCPTGPIWDWERVA